MADLFGLSGYNSDNDKGEAAGSSSSEEGSDNSSVDSAELRAREADARLKDFHKEDRRAPTSVLPSACDAFDEVDGPPEFLDPEATRPLATSTHDRVAAPVAAAAGKEGWHGPKGRVPAGQEFDIARLAPLIKGQKRDVPDGGRVVPAGAVVEGKAKRYKEEGPEATQQYSAVQIAMLGGQVKGPVPDTAGAAGTKQGSGAVSMQDFMDKGGAVALPRKQQDRKDKEKQKRSKGQSGVTTWKTEAEMVLRQQYDS